MYFTIRVFPIIAEYINILQTISNSPLKKIVICVIICIDKKRKA